MKYFESFLILIYFSNMQIIFYFIEYCSVECLAGGETRKRKAKPLNPKKIVNKSNTMSAKDKKHFRWSKFLSTDVEGSAAPINLFLNPFPIGNNPFSIGMKLEAVDPDNCSLFCIVTIIQIKGYRLQLHFDGYEHIYDYWVNADSMDIFPWGWCGKTGRVLQPPKHYDRFTFNPKKYAEYCGCSLAERHLFTHLNSISSDFINPFKVSS